MRCSSLPLIVMGVCVAASSAVGGAVEEAGIRAEAFVGEPFGVGRVVVSTAPAGENDAPVTSTEFLTGLRLRSADGRAHYPAFLARGEETPNRWRMYRNDISEADVQLIAPTPGPEARTVTAYFLFHGSEPLELTLLDGRGESGRAWSIAVTPTKDADAFKRYRTYWWAAMGASARRNARVDGYSAQVETYVRAMLNRRLELPTRDHWNRRRFRGDWWELAGILTGAESVRLAMQEDMLLSDSDAPPAVADQPLPEALLPEAVEIPTVTGHLAVEPIAMMVPEECFYVRCGSFANFRWLAGLVERWGGDVRDIALSRGLDAGVRARLETQLGLRETALARVLGDALIEDMAVIGTDGFVREGAAVGVLFQAKAGAAAALGDQIRRQRRTMMGAARGVEETLPLAGEDVSFMRTPDNRMRSFHASAGTYHLVTTSQTIARRFLEIAASGDGLGASEEFRFARRKMPLSRGDRAFVYLSDAFFRNLLSPQYRIEMIRRMRAETRIQLVSLARLAAAGEGSSARTIDALIAGGFLPADFDVAFDGGGVRDGDGGVVFDVLRGRRGTFLPVPDVEISGCTAVEVEDYQRFAKWYRENWRYMDPVMVGLGSAALDGGERIVMDLYLAPYAPRHYEAIAPFLPLPDKMVIRQSEKNLLRVQVNVDSTALMGMMMGGAPSPMGAMVRATTPPLRGYAGVRDIPMEWKVVHGEPEIVGDEEEVLSEFQAYLGVTPPMVAMQILGPMGAQPDAVGYFNCDRFWGRSKGGFVTMSPSKAMLKSVTDDLALDQAQRRAQLRVSVGDLAGSKFADALHTMSYLYARKMSDGSAMFLDALVQWLNVPPADAMTAAADVLGSTLVCPLGGEYRLADGPAGVWESSAWTTPTRFQLNSVPAAYRCALLEAFGGADLEFSLDRTKQSLRTRLQLDLKGQ